MLSQIKKSKAIICDCGHKATERSFSTSVDRNQTDINSIILSNSGFPWGDEMNLATGTFTMSQKAPLFRSKAPGHHESCSKGFVYDHSRHDTNSNHCLNASLRVSGNALISLRIM